MKRRTALVGSLATPLATLAGSLPVRPAAVTQVDRSGAATPARSAASATTSRASVASTTISRKIFQQS